MPRNSLEKRCQRSASSPVPRRVLTHEAKLDHELCSSFVNA